MASMVCEKRANGAGTVYIKHGSYYGRWTTESGGRTNRMLGPVRKPGAAAGLTRAQNRVAIARGDGQPRGADGV